MQLTLHIALRFVAPQNDRSSRAMVLAPCSVSLNIWLPECDTARPVALSTQAPLETSGA